MIIYFRRPPTLLHLTYVNFSASFTYHYDSVPASSNEFYELPGQQRRLFIYKKTAAKASLIRLAPVPYNCGEKFYLRLLLLNIPASSFKELKGPFDTFQKSALHKKLLKESTEAYIAFEEALLYSSPTELRTMFVIQTLQGFPTLQIFDNLDMRQAMYEDFLMNDNCRGNHDFALNFLLKDLSRKFKASDKTLADFGLPSIRDDIDTEIDIQRARYACEQQAQYLRHLETIAPNNPEQQQLFDVIKTHIQNNTSALIFLQGQGGEWNPFKHLQLNL